jgi:uncharacterized integral membrane protein (TIGR00698 family)
MSQMLTSMPTPSVPAVRRSLVPGLVLAGLGFLGATRISDAAESIPLIVAAVMTGAIIGNVGLTTAEAAPGLSFASKHVLRVGIVLLGLRLSLGDIVGLGIETLVVIVATVTLTFVTVQVIGRKLGLSPALSLLVASGFSICGNSAIASVNGIADAEEEEVAAAVGLVTLCGTAAIAVVPALGSLLGLSDVQLGVWTGASVQDTAQVIAVASAAGPSVLAVAAAVKLTRVLFLAPIVAGVSISRRSDSAPSVGKRPPLVPLFVVGFLAAVTLRTTTMIPDAVLEVGSQASTYALAIGMVGLGTSVRLRALRRLGLRPLVLGLVAWGIVGSIALGAITVLGI